MGQTRGAIDPNLAARWCGPAARRDDARVARRLYRTPGGDGVSRLDAGALLDDGVDVVPPLGGVEWRHDVRRTAIPRVRVPVGQDVVRSSLKPRFGVDRLQALPPWLCRAEALMRLVGCKAPPGRQGVCPRGAAPRQGPRTAGPIGPDTLAEPRVPRHGRDLAALVTRVVRALATAGVWAAQVTGLGDAPELETPAPDAGCGQGTRPRQGTDTPGQVREREGTVSGLQRSVVLAARTPRPLAATVVPLQEPEGRATRALVTPARPPLAGHARRHTVGVERGVWEGGARWGLDPHGLRWVVPATDHRAVTLDAQAQAAAGDGVTMGRRAPTRRQGQGRAARTARLETAVGGSAGLTPADP